MRFPAAVPDWDAAAAWHGWPTTEGAGQATRASASSAALRRAATAFPDEPQAAPAAPGSEGSIPQAPPLPPEASAAAAVAAAGVAAAKKKADEAMTACQEGFRCVSRVRRFGDKHTIGADVNAAPVIKDPADKAYEWNCPARGIWSQSEFESGSEPGMCLEEKDCICISRSSPNMEVFLNNGDEKITGKFMVQTRNPDSALKEETLTVVPHYRMREVPANFDPTEVTSEIGRVNWLPKDVWLSRFQDVAPKTQVSLDTLHDVLMKDYVDKVRERAFQCKLFPGQQETASRLRRLQLLTSDCSFMRDIVARLSGSPEAEKFPGEFKDKKLHCYKNRNEKGVVEDGCQQLNCYRGVVDGDFRAAMQEFKAKLDTCVPDQDVPDEAGYAPTLEELHELNAVAAGPGPGGQVQQRSAGGCGPLLLALAASRRRGRHSVPTHRAVRATRRRADFL